MFLKNTDPNPDPDPPLKMYVDPEPDLDPYFFFKANATSPG
jgi:hypothetical protein